MESEIEEESMSQRNAQETPLLFSENLSANNRAGIQSRQIIQDNLSKVMQKNKGSFKDSRAKSKSRSSRNNLKIEDVCADEKNNKKKGKTVRFMD